MREEGGEGGERRREERGGGREHMSTPTELLFTVTMAFDHPSPLALTITP